MLDLGRIRSTTALSLFIGGRYAGVVLFLSLFYPDYPPILFLLRLLQREDGIKKSWNWGRKEAAHFPLPFRFPTSSCGLWSLTAEILGWFDQNSTRFQGSEFSF